MKKFLFSLMAIVLVSVSSFGQGGKDGCIKLPKGLEDIIKDQITLVNNPFGSSTSEEAKLMGKYLFNFNKSLSTTLTTGKLPISQEEVNNILKEVKSNDFYAKAKEMSENSTSLNDLRGKISQKIKVTKDKSELKSLILWDYQLQVMNHYANDTYKNSVNVKGPNGEIELVQSWWNSWGRCASAILGGAGTGALAGAGVGSIVPGLGTAAGGIIGGISGGLTGAAAGC